MFYDNGTAILIAEDPIFYERIKHVEFDVHILREMISSRLIQVSYIYSKE